MIVSSDNNFVAQRAGKIQFSKLLCVSILIATLLFFLVLPLRSTIIRHGVVLIGSLLVYLAALHRILTNRLSVKYFVLISWLLIQLFFEILALSRSIDFDLIYSTLNFVALTIIMSTDSPDGLLDDSTKKAVLRFAQVSTIILLVLSRSNIAYLSETGYNNGFLVLGMTNSNLTGMLLFGIFSILIIYSDNESHKAITGILLLILLYLLYLSGSRSALISAFIVFIYAIFFSEKRLPKTIILVSAIFPVVVIPIYLSLFNQLGIGARFLGKPLFSGRQYTLLQVLSERRSIGEFLFGNVVSSNFSNTNAPNGPLAIFMFSGLIGVLIFYYLIIGKVIRRNNDSSSKMSRIAILCVLSFFIQSAAEAFLFTGIFPGIAFMYLVSVLMDS